MRFPRLRAFITSALLTFTVGCTVIPFTIVPKNIGEQGLLVAQVIEDTGTYAGPEQWMDPVINGIRHKGGNRDHGHIMVPLYPGDYTLDALQQVSEGETMPTAVGSMTTITSSWYDIKQRFTIRAGRTTNLGLLVIRIRPEGLTGGDTASTGHRGKPLYLYFVDNTREINEYLQTKYPDLYGSLQERPVALAPNAYLSPRDLASLRRSIAVDRIRAYPDQYGDESVGYLTAGNGLMARIIRNSDGKITAVNPLEIQGFPDLSDCDVSERRAVCFLSETEYLVANGETVERRAVPTGISANSVRMLDDTTLIVVDKHAAVLTSRDDGKTWKQYAGPPRANPLSRARMVRLLKGKDRYYLYSSHAAADETFVLSADYATNTYEQFPLRPKTKRIDGLYETDYGLYLDPWNAGFFSDTLYVYPWSTKTWESRDLPMNCSGLRFVDRSGMRIDTTCHGGYAIPFRTEDGGHTWGRG